MPTLKNRVMITVDDALLDDIKTFADKYHHKSMSAACVALIEIALYETEDMPRPSYDISGIKQKLREIENMLNEETGTTG